VRILMATSMATVSPIGDIYRSVNLFSLGQTLSGWRDSNSRPLDPRSADSLCRVLLSCDSCTAAAGETAM
jgi:hypothetical protein